jgi:hypothetical protein
MGAIAIAFFLPFVRVCNHVESAWELADVPWVAPPFVGAAILALLTIWLLARKRIPSRGILWVAAIAAGLTAVADLGAAASLIYDGAEWNEPLWWFISGWAIVAGLVSLAILRSARVGEPWARWASILATHAVASSYLCAWLVMFLVDQIESGGEQVGIGGFTYLLSVITLLVIFAHERRGRSRR